PKVNSFLGELVSSPFMGLLSQYSTPNYPIGPGRLVGTFPSGQITTNDTSSGRVLTDYTIQRALGAMINSKSPRLPAPDPNMLYCVFAPPGALTDKGNAVLGYHDTFWINSFLGISGGTPVHYAVVTLPTDPSGTSYQGTASHEIAEAVTDPIVGR